MFDATEVWRIAEERRARVLLRIEDHDRMRCRPEYEEAIREDLAWLDFVPDAQAPRQSERQARYAEVLADLEARGFAYPCTCSRRDIAAAAGDVFNEESRYPGTCRHGGVDPGSTAARRVRMAPGEEAFTDLRLGPQSQAPADQCGDFLIRDRFGNWTYQFCVTVDDFDHGVTLVVRGEDLLASTGRQIRLARLIGRTAMPEYLHHALLRKPGGAKLSKSDGDTGIRELRAAGMSPTDVIALATRWATPARQETR